MKLTKLIVKNFKIIMRSRISSLIIIFGPLLIMLLAGFAFNNSASFDLNLGVYAPEPSALTANFTDSLSHQFKIFTYTDELNCVEDVRNLKLHSCLVFSPNFEIAAGNNNTITIHVDNSKVNIVDLIQNALDKVITVQSSQIGADLAGVLIININQASSEMDAWQNQSITTILASNKGIGASVDADKNKWSSLILDYTPKDPVLTNIAAEQFAVSNATAEVLADAQSAADIGQTLITSIKNSNTSISGINSLLNSAQTQVTNIQNNINTDGNASTDSVAALQSAVQNLSSLVNEMADKIAQADTLRADLLKRFDSYKTQLATVETQLNALADQIKTESDKLKNIKVKDASTIASPVKTQIAPVVTSFSKLNYIFPSLMMLVIMFVCVMLSATIVVIEKLSSARFRLFTTPTSDIVFITSNFITTLLVAVVQIILMICIASFVFHIDVFSNIANTSAILFIGAIVFTLLGMCLGYVFANEQTTILAAISLGSAFILVSDLILPLESISTGLRNVVAETPFVLLTGLLRRTILFGANIKELGADFYIIVIYCVSLFAIIVIAHKLLKVLYLVSNTKKGRRKA